MINVSLKRELQSYLRYTFQVEKLEEVEKIAKFFLKKGYVKFGKEVYKPSKADNFGREEFEIFSGKCMLPVWGSLKYPDFKIVAWEPRKTSRKLLEARRRPQEIGGSYIRYG